MMTSREVARRLRISVATLRRERLAGRISYLKVRGVFRYRESDVEDYAVHESEMT